MVRSERRNEARQIEVVVGETEYALLRSLNFPGTTGILASAERTDEGMVLRMSRDALEDFVGWVAGEANHTRGRRCADLLNQIADAMESALSLYR
jgi:hypothetical protein